MEEISRAMVELADHPEKRKQMGENGYKRLLTKYQIEDMQRTYEKLYDDFEDIMTKKRMERRRKIRKA